MTLVLPYPEIRQESPDNVISIAWRKPHSTGEEVSPPYVTGAPDEAPTVTPSRRDWIAAINRQFGATALGIYVYLKACADDDQRVSMSYGELAELCHVSRRHVIRLVGSLEGAGWLSCEPSRDDRNGHAANTITLLTPSDIPSDIPSDTGTKLTNSAHPPLVTDPSDIPSDTLSHTLSITTNDEEKEPLSVVSLQPNGAKPAKPQRSRPAVPWPDDFTLTDERRQMARDKGLDDRRIDVQWERFKNHAEQNDRRVKVWDAAWRNWILTDLDKNGPSGTGGKALPWNSPKRRQLVVG